MRDEFGPEVCECAQCETDDAYGMRTLAPLYEVQSTRERSFEEKGSSPGSDASCWPCLMCVCALIKGKIFSLTAYHFYVFFRDGKIPLNSGNGSNLWYRSNKPRKLWAFESHTELQQSYRGLRSLFCFFEKKKRRRQTTDDFTSCHIGAPLLEDSTDQQN